MRSIATEAASLAEAVQAQPIKEIGEAIHAKAEEALNELAHDRSSRRLRGRLRLESCESSEHGLSAGAVDAIHAGTNRAVKAAEATQRSEARMLARLRTTRHAKEYFTKR